MAPFGLKLWENAFQIIPDISFFDAENKIGNFFFGVDFFFGVEKSKVANRLKRVFPKFEAKRSHPRGVNGRSKFRGVTMLAGALADVSQHVSRR